MCSLSVLGAVSLSQQTYELSESLQHIFQKGFLNLIDREDSS